MIFEELEGTPTLRALRVVSQQFEDLVVPILYRHVTLTAKLIDEYVPPNDLSPEHDPDFEELREIASTYLREGRRALFWNDIPPVQRLSTLYFQMGIFTRHINVDRDFARASVWKLLEDLSNLESIT